MLFEKERLIEVNIKQLMNTMKNQLVILDAYSGSFFDILYLDSISNMYIQDILMINNLFILRKLKNTARYNECYATFSLFGDQASIELFNYNKSVNSYDITIEELEIILHRIFSLGIHLQNENWFDFKFVK